MDDGSSDESREPDDERRDSTDEPADDETDVEDESGSGDEGPADTDGPADKAQSGDTDGPADDDSDTDDDPDTDDESANDETGTDEEVEWHNPAADAEWADELDDPEEYIDEDDEIPEWAEEAKRERIAREEEKAREEYEEYKRSRDRETGRSADDGGKHDLSSPGLSSGQAAGAGDDDDADDDTDDVGGAIGGDIGDGLMGGGEAPDDQEMPLTEHVEEMALRFMAVGLVVVGVGAITLFYADDLINFLWYSFLGPGVGECLDLATFEVRPSCPESIRPRVYHPLALVLARLKVASLVGVIVALPVAVYQTYRFMRPGLYPRERRYYLAAVPTSLVLATVGVAFAYFAILPAMFQYFTAYSERAADIAFGLTETFNLIVLMLGFFALTFQIPLLVMLAIMMGVTTRQWLADRRLYFWGGFGAIAFLFSPDPTGMAPLLVALTMIALFDGTLLLLKWTSSESLVPTADGLAARRPYAWVVAVLVGYLLSPAPVPQGYYDYLPPVVIETLVANDLVSMTPVIIGAGLILLFEFGSYVLRQFGRSERALRARLFVARIRIPVWVAAVAVGYFGSPEPLFLHLADDFAVQTIEAIAITGGLLILYELAIGVMRVRGSEE